DAGVMTALAPVLYTLPLHDALPLCELWAVQRAAYVDEAQIYGDPFVLPLTESRGQLLRAVDGGAVLLKAVCGGRIVGGARGKARSEEHTSELQSRENLVCRLLLEKK